MKNKPSYSYSQSYSVRWALEMELNRMKVIENRQDVFRVMSYLEERIAELKREEAECLRIQTS
jgi:hypothetical protein